MRIGTPGFIAARLTEGREARGVTQTVLSELTGIKSQSISHYEQGRQSPSPEALSLLAAALELPERFFLRPAPAFNGASVFFRQHGSASRANVRAARLKAERRLAWLKQIAVYVRQYVDLPAVRLPNRFVAPDAVRAKEIEQIADDARVAFGLNFGPPEDLIPVLEEAGWVIAQCSMDAELGGSWSHWNEGVPYLALCAGETRPSWVQYNAARELGHMIMHRDLSPADMEDACRHQNMELQADHFARAFLLPARTFTNEVWAPSINALLSLKKDWRCPISVMVSRCGELGLLDQDQIRRAGTNIVRRGWKAVEPREAPEPQKPQLLGQSIELMIREGIKDRHTILTDLALSASDVEELCGLVRGALLCPANTHHPAVLKLRAIESELQVQDNLA